MPRWSDGEEAAAGGAAEPGLGLAPVTAGARPEATPPPGPASAHEPRACAWCATTAAVGATRCSTCGAALAQRESIGDLLVPGLTAVDPALKDLDSRPVHLRGPSPSQGIASGLILAAAAGGPMGLAILGGVGAIAATEFLGTGDHRAKGRQHVGETSEAVRQAIERLERGETLRVATDPTALPELDTGATTGPAGNQEESIDGRS